MRRTAGKLAASRGSDGTPSLSGQGIRRGRRSSPRRACSAIRLAVVAGLATGLASHALAQQVTSTWQGGSGSWSDATRWSTNPLYPNNAGGQTFVAVLPQGTGTVTLANAVQVDRVQLLGSSGLLHVNGGTLGLADRVDIVSDATIRLDFGTIQGGTLNVGTSGNGLKFFRDANFLRSVTIQGDVVNDFARFAGATVTGGLTLNGTFRNANAGSFLSFSGTQAVSGNGIFALDGPAADSETALYVGSNSTITLNNGIVVRGGNAVVTRVAGGQSYSLINQGRISADIAGRALDVFEVDLQNDGTIEAINGGRLRLGTRGNNPTTWSNSGTIRAGAGSTLELGGTFSLAPSSVFDTSAGSVVLSGRLNNGAHTFNLDASTGSWELRGQVFGGNVTTAPGQQFVTTGGNALLNGVAYDGSLLANGGRLVIDGGSLNGNLAAQSSATVDFQGNWSSGATITATNATINLGGTFSLLPTFNAQQTNSQINLIGTALNTGNTITLNQSTGSWNFGGTIQGGTLRTQGGASLNGSGTLVGVTLGSAFPVAPGSTILVRDSLTGGAMNFSGDRPILRFDNNATLSGTSIGIQASQPSGGLDGRLEVLQTSSLTTDPATTIRGGNFSILNNGRFVNNGVIQADLPGQSILISNVNVPNSFVNQGELRALNGGTIVLPTITGALGNATVVGAGSAMRFGTSGSSTPAIAMSGVYTVSGGGRLDVLGDSNLTGTITANSGSSVALGGAWQNHGQININDSTLDLGGTFTPASLGVINRSNGTVRIAGGSFDLGGGTFTSTATSGPNTLVGGLVRNGTFTVAAGTALNVLPSPFGVHNSFEFMSLNGRVQVQNTELSVVGALLRPGSEINLRSGTLSLFDSSNSGTINADPNSTVNLGGSNITLSQVGTINKSGNAQVNLVGNLNASGQTITISPTSLLTGITRGGRLTANTLALSSNPTLNLGYGSTIAVNQVSGTGTIASLGGDLSSPLPTGTLTINSGVTLRGSAIVGRLGETANPALDHVVNQGTMRFDDSSNVTFLAGGSFTNTGTIEVAGGDVRFYNTVRNYPTFYTNWSNAGVIRVSSGTLMLGGAFSYDGLGTIEHTGGRILLAGQFDLTGHSATLGAGLLDWEVPFDTEAEIRGGTLSFTPGYRPAYLTLNGTTVNGDIDWTDGPLYIRGGFASNGIIRLRDRFTSVRFKGGNQTIASGTFDLGDSGGALYYDDTGGANTLFGPGVVVRGSSGGVSASNLTNQGLISANAPGTGLSIGGGFVNQGTIEAINGGTLNVGASSWTNSGIVRVGSGSSMSLRGLLNAGGSISNQGGLLVLQGRTTNTNSTLTIDAPSGSTRLEGEIFGGTVNITPGTTVDSFAYYQPGNLNGTTINGNLRVPASSGAGLVVHNGLSLNGSIQVLGGEVHFANSQTLTGGTIALEALGALATRVSADLGTAVTLSPSTVIRGGRASILPNQLITLPSQRNALINQGRIAADIPGTTLEIAADNFTNTGIVEALNGATLSIGGFGAGVDPAGVRERQWSGNGIIRAVDSSVSLGGHFASTALSQLDLTNSSVTVTGAMNNTGRTLDLDGPARSLSLFNGFIQAGSPVNARIIGGTVNFRNGAQLVVPSGDGGGTIDGATVSGDVSVSGTLNLYRGAQLAGTTQLIGGGTLNIPFTNGVPAVQHLQSGTFVFAGQPGQFAKIASDDLEIGAEVVIRGGQGLFQRAVGASGSQRLVNFGRISADVPGQTLVVGAPAGTFINSGTLEALNGATLSVGAGTHTPSSSIRVIDSTLEINGGSTSIFSHITRSNATINFTGRVENTGRTLDFDAATHWNLNSGLTFKGGVVNIAPGTTLPVGVGVASLGPVTFDGVTIHGDLMTTPTVGGVQFYNGLRLSGTLAIPTPNAAIEFFGSQTVQSGTFFFDSRGGAGERTVDFRGLGAQGAGQIAVTLAPDVTFHGGDVTLRMGWGTDADTLINQGLILADQAGKTFAIDQARFANMGIVQAINGGIIRYDGPPPFRRNDDITFVNSGVLAAGAGSVLSFGGLQNDAMGVISIELSGSFGEPAGGLLVADMIVLGGTLNIDLAQGYVPTLGDRWEVLRFGAARGGFEHVFTPELLGGLFFDTSRLLSDGTISVVPSPATPITGVVISALVAARRRRVS